MGIALDQWRVSIGLFHNCISSSKKIFTFSLNLRSIFLSILKLSKLFSWLCYYTNSVLVLNFCNFRCFLIVLMLLLQAGDIETNPGPENIYDLSIVHLNIRSIRNKIEYITDNLLDFNILCFTETHLDANVSTEMLFLSNAYSAPYRKDRTNHGGGILAYLNSSLLHARRPDLEIFCDESIWIEVNVKTESFLIGVFYSPTTSNSQFF